MSRKKYHNVVISKGGNKVHIACHNLDSGEENYQLRCLLVIVIFGMVLLFTIAELYNCETYKEGRAIADPV
jgi:hypothetical protein